MRIDPRHYTNKLLEMIYDGLLDRETVILAMASYLSDNDVRDMMECNEMLEEEDEAREDDGQPTEREEWASFDQPDPHYFGGEEEEDEDEVVDPMDFDP
jgi:hypothetical protein